MLVLSAENNFETSNPKKVHKKTSTKFSPEQTEAYKEHELVCKEWRVAGRPKDNSHPAKSKKLESQRSLQRISRESEANEAMKNHNE